MPYAGYSFIDAEPSSKVICLSLFDALCMFYGVNPDQRNVIETKES